MDQTIPQAGWWSRNWKWFVPVGCLSLLATCGCCIGGVFLVGYQGYKGINGDQGARPDVTVEPAADRPGADFRDYEMADGDASKCALDCAGEPRCRAYTFVKPANGKPGRCRLKDRAPARVPGDCCISGVKK